MVDYGGQVSTPRYTLIVTHGDLMVNVVFLQLLWVYNVVRLQRCCVFTTVVGLQRCCFYTLNFLLHRNDFFMVVLS